MAQQQILELGSARFGLVDVPRLLYKFFEKAEYAAAFVRKGTVRIGTLYDFRRTEAHDLTRADAGEGQFNYTHRSAFPEMITLDNAPPHIRAYIEQTGIPIASHGGTITAKAEHPDCFVFCASKSMKAGGLGYGSFGVRISDSHAFFGELTRHLHRNRKYPLLKHPHGFAAPCLYGKRESVARSLGADFVEVPLAFIKPETKASEQEVRGVWHPSRHPIEPFITHCPKLTPFLSRMEE